MSDNKPARNTSSIISLALPCLTLALTVAAFAVGAPARLARLTVHPPALLAELEFDASIRYEPVVSTDQGGFRLVAASRVLDQLVSRQLIAFK